MNKNLKQLKLFEAYRYSEVLGKEFILDHVRAANEDAARKHFKDKFEKNYGDTRPFKVRQKV